MIPINLTSTEDGRGHMEGLEEVLDCPVYSDSDKDLLNFFSFWVEGILTTAFAILGIFGNTIVSVIIAQRDMRNSFNLLLVSLACFDSTYLFGSILESFRKDFHLASQTHIVLFPHFLYPLNQVAISGSIFMTVAIAWERYVAVHYPLDYNQAMNDANAIRKRLLKYVGPSFLLAFFFNIVKFFEAKVEYVQSKGGNLTQEEIEYVAELQVADLRTHPAYSAYNNWSRLVVLGIVPFTLLVFFNTKIYKDISERRKRRLRTCSRASVSNVLTEFVSVPQSRHSGIFMSTSQPLLGLMKRSMTSSKSEAKCNAGAAASESIDLASLPAAKTNGESAPGDSPKSVASSGGLKLALDKASSGEASSLGSKKAVSFENAGDPLLDGVDEGAPDGTTTAVLTIAAAAATATNSRLQLRHVQHCNERRRIFEDNLAAVCMGFVLVFLVCHVPRLLLNIHELVTIREAMKCGELGHHPFSVWSMVTISVSHFLLVLNSATNILVYCLLSSKFREECGKIMKACYANSTCYCWSAWKANRAMRRNRNGGRPFKRPMMPYVVGENQADHNNPRPVGGGSPSLDIIHESGTTVTRASSGSVSALKL